MITQTTFLYFSLVFGILASLIFVLCYKWNIYQKNFDKRVTETFIDSLVIGAITFLVFMLVGSWVCDYLPRQHFLYDVDNKNISVVASDEDIWFMPWAILPKNYEEIPYGEYRYQVSMNCSPVTENPKVRNLRYVVIIKTKSSPEDGLAFFERPEGIKDIGAWLEKQLYDMNEFESKELAKFYNPRDEGQQTSFEALVRKFLERQFELYPFLELDSAHFELQ